MTLANDFPPLKRHTQCYTGVRRKGFHSQGGPHFFRHGVQVEAPGKLHRKFAFHLVPAAAQTKAATADDTVVLFFHRGLPDREREGRVGEKNGGFSAGPDVVQANVGPAFHEPAMHRTFVVLAHQKTHPETFVVGIIPGTDGNTQHQEAQATAAVLKPTLEFKHKSGIGVDNVFDIYREFPDHGLKRRDANGVLLGIQGIKLEKYAGDYQGFKQNLIAGFHCDLNFVMGQRWGYQQPPWN